MEKTTNNNNLSPDDYYSILSMYVSCDEELPSYNEWMMKPFFINELAMATDTEVMVWFDKKLTQELAPCGASNPDNVLSIIPKEFNYDLTIKTSDIQEAFDKHAVSGYAICKACNGDTSVDFEFKFNKKKYIKTEECPVCNGLRKDSNLDKFYIDICNCRFSARIINILLYTARNLNESDIVLKQQLQHNKSSLFKIGNVNVLAMPCIGKEHKTPILTIF